jgi:hypothetical protein
VYLDWAAGLRGRTPCLYSCDLNRQQKSESTMRLNPDNRLPFRQMRFVKIGDVLSFMVLAPKLG